VVYSRLIPALDLKGIQQMVIRQAAESDIAGILRVHHDNGLYAVPDPSSDYKSAIEYYTRLVADEGGEVIGFGLLRGTSIDALYVLEGRQGGKIGSRLLEGLESLAEGKGIKVLHVNANPRDKCKLDDLRRFYKRSGYKELIVDVGQGWAEFTKELELPRA
jgi:GNAT superfamily N-acetyltransferase